MDGRRRYLLYWIPVPILFGLFVWLFPDTTIESIVITQIPFLALTGLVVAYVVRGSVSDGGLRLATAFAALAGLAYAAYLTYEWSQGSVPQCATGGCTVAQFSEGAELFFGLRTSTVGVIGYCLILVSLLLPGIYGRASTWALGTFGFGTSIYLTSYSIFELKTTCQWCLGSAAAMTTIFAIASIRLIKAYLEGGDAGSDLDDFDDLDGAHLDDRDDSPGPPATPAG
jgi:uncharacterized membrane protein